MIRAIVKNGMLQPLDPLPSEWREGQELEVHADAMPPADADRLDEWWQDLEIRFARMPEDPEDRRSLHDALNEQRRVAKELVRREMELS